MKRNKELPPTFWTGFQKPHHELEPPYSISGSIRYSTIEYPPLELSDQLQMLWGARNEMVYQVDAMLPLDLRFLERSVKVEREMLVFTIEIIPKEFSE